MGNKQSYPRFKHSGDKPNVEQKASHTDDEPAKITRRDVLSRAAGAGLAGLTGAMPSALKAQTAEPAAEEAKKELSEPLGGFSNYGQPSVHQKRLIRWISNNPTVPTDGVSWTPLHLLNGTITPNGLHYERHHNGVPAIDPNQHRLNILGLVETPLTFAWQDLLFYPMHSQQYFIECGGNSNSGWLPEPAQSAAGYLHGLVSAREWSGVMLKTLFTETGLRENAKWLIATGADPSGFSMSIPLDKALDDCMLALYQNGEYVRPENGFPMRLIVPGWEGVTHVKWVKQLMISDQPLNSRFETSSYTELLPDGRADKFSFEIGVKSLITFPAAGHTLPRAGWYEITGLAWSGKDVLAKVEVSSDGGESWQVAKFDQPPAKNMFSRFSLPWHWQEQEVTLMSRAYDQQGNVQLMHDELVQAKGHNVYYHYNGIICWQIDGFGDIRHAFR